MKIKFVKIHSPNLLTEEVLFLLLKINECKSYQDIVNIPLNKKTTFRFVNKNFVGYQNKDIIIKVGGQCKSIRKIHLADKYHPVLAVPTIVVKTDHKLAVRIQPRVDVSIRSKRKVIKEILQHSKKHVTKCFGADPHEGNIGLLNGDPVVFDW